MTIVGTLKKTAQAKAARMVAVAVLACSSLLKAEEKTEALPAQPDRIVQYADNKDNSLIGQIKSGEKKMSDLSQDELDQLAREAYKEQKEADRKLLEDVEAGKKDLSSLSEEEKRRVAHAYGVRAEEKEAEKNKAIQEEFRKAMDAITQSMEVVNDALKTVPGNLGQKSSEKTPAGKLPPHIQKLKDSLNTK